MEYQSELITLIQREADKDRDFYKYLFQNKNQSIAAIFRSLNPMVKQIVLRRVYLGQPYLDFYESQCLEAKPLLKQYFEPMFLGKVVPSKRNPGKEEFEIQSEFAEGIKDIIDGKSIPCLEIVRQTEMLEETVNQWKRECQSKWKRLFNVISQPERQERNDYGQRIQLTLHNSKLLQRDSDQGFEFILTSTRQQINMLITHYITEIKKSHSKQTSFINVIRFILELSTLDPFLVYSIASLDQYQMDIIEDFHQIGFVFKEGRTIRITYLLWNFLHEQPQVSIDIRCRIIVEANFRVYAYLESKDQMEESILYNLLKLFSEVKYRFPNLIIADLNLTSVSEAFRRNLKATQIIQFFEMNNRTPKEQIQPIIETTEKQKNKEAIQQDMRKRLSFLRIFQEDTSTQTSVLPHNIVQQLKFWEQESRQYR